MQHIKKTYQQFLFLLLYCICITCNAQNFTELIKYKIEIKENKEPGSPYYDFIYKVQSDIKHHRVNPYNTSTGNLCTEKEREELFIASYTLTSAQRSYPPYEAYDTLIIESLDMLKRVVSITFYESWSMDKHGKIKKEVLAYKFSINTYTYNGMLRGPMDLCLIYCGKKNRHQLDSILGDYF
jgi:hypothetical protein